MSVVSERVKAERLHLVQAAARYVLTTTAADPAITFRAVEIFPDGKSMKDMDRAEYSWRNQLSWAWTQAGYLNARILGRGFQKHTSYVLTAEGRRALLRIGADPVVASFYIGRKRTGTHPHVGNAAYFQPPELRADLKEMMSGAVPLADDLEDEPDDDETADDRAADDDAVVEAGEGGGDAASGTLAVFFERSIAVLENMNGKLGLMEARLGRLEDEVKTQSELVVSVTARMEDAATRRDLGEAAAEMVAAVVKAAPKPVTLPTIPDVTSDVRLLASGVKALAAMIDDVHTAVTDLATRPVTVTAAAVPSKDTTEDVFTTLGALRGRIEEIFERLNKPIELSVGNVDELQPVMEEIHTAVGKLGDKMTQLVENIESVEDAYLRTSEAHRKSMIASNETLREISEAATIVMDGAKYVAGELLNMTLNTSQDEIGKRAATELTAQAMQNFAASRDALKNRVSALGGGLLLMRPFTPDRVDPLVLTNEGEVAGVSGVRK